MFPNNNASRSAVNPLTPGGLVNPYMYQLDELFLLLGVSGVVFHFDFIFSTLRKLLRVYSVIIIFLFRASFIETVSITCLLIDV